MNRKSLHILLLLTCLGTFLQAQVSPLADQYLINSFLTNPALTGTTSKAPLSISARQQWLGISGAPSWQSATYHRTLHANQQHFNPRGFVNKGDNQFGKVGLGGGLFSVKYGAISQVGLHLDYAYHVFLSNGRLSFGLAPMYFQYVINKSGFITPDGTTPDPMIDGDAREVLHFIDVNAGVQYTSGLFFAGFSAVQLFNSSVSFGELSFPSVGEFSDNPWLARSLYLYGGVTPEISKTLILEPSIVIKYNSKTGPGFQVNLKTTINENFQVGLLYHFKESAGFFAGVRFNDLIFRYQFEFPIGTDMQVRFTTNSVLAGILL